MTQIATYAPGSVVSRKYAVTMGRVTAIWPDCKSITDTVGNLNSMDQINDLGLPAPDNAPTTATNGAGTLIGNYLYYVTLLDNNTEAESPPSAVSISVTAASNKVRVTLTPITNESANGRVTHFRIYRNTASGTIYYPVTDVTIATTTYDDNTSDAVLSAQGTLDTLDTTFSRPASSTYGLCRAHKGFVCVAGAYNHVGGTDYDDRFLWFEAGSVDRYRSYDGGQCLKGRNGIIRALSSVGDTFVFFKDSAIVEFVFGDYPNEIYGDGFSKCVNYTRGAINQRCVIEIQGVNYVMDQQGVYVYSGGTQIIEISTPLAAYWERINWAEKDRFSAVAGKDRIWFFVALDGETECRYAFMYNLRAARSGQPTRWWLERYDFGIRDAVAYNFGQSTPSSTYYWDNQTAPVVMTDSGYVMVLGCGYRDGVHPRLTANGTFTGGSSTTMVDSGATFSLTNGAGETANVNGCYIRFYDTNNNVVAGWDSAYLITGVSGTTLTISGMPADPTGVTGLVKYIIGGSPTTVYKTGQLSFGAPGTRKRVGHLQVEYQPTGLETQVRVTAYADRRAPRNNGSVASSETGWATDAGQPYKRLRLGGAYVASTGTDEGIGQLDVPLLGESFNYLQVALSIVGVDYAAVIDALDYEVLDT